jgi:tRNA G46 methylase TrmB
MKMRKIMRMMRRMRMRMMMKRMRMKRRMKRMTMKRKSMPKSMWALCQRPVPQRIALGSCKGENSLQSASSSDAIAFTCLFAQVLENSLQSAKWQ